jgi:hypothetical protein
MPIFLRLPPLPFNINDALSLPVWTSPTLRSHISCARAPLAYIVLKSVLSLNSMARSFPGKFNNIETSFNVKTARVLCIPFFEGSFLTLSRNTVAASKFRFWAYSANDDKADNLWFRVDALQPRSSNQIKKSNMFS